MSLIFEKSGREIVALNGDERHVFSLLSLSLLKRKDGKPIIAYISSNSSKHVAASIPQQKRGATMQKNPTKLNGERPNPHGRRKKSKELQQLGTAAKETLETAVQNTKQQHRRRQRRGVPDLRASGGRRRASKRRLITEPERITTITEAGIAAVERWAGAGSLPAEQKEVLVHMGAALNAAVYSAKTMEETLDHIHLVLRAAYFYGVAQPQRLPAHHNGNGKDRIPEDLVAE